ncbi:MAG: SPOR domain-containing protein [Lautropia sp.]
MRRSSDVALQSFDATRPPRDAVTHSPPIARQRGGSTLIGILIGIVLGLGIAVVTAVLVTKTSVPFLGPIGKPSERAAPGAAPPTAAAPAAPKPQVSVAAGDLPDPNRSGVVRPRAVPGQPAVQGSEVATVNAPPAPGAPAGPAGSPPSGAAGAGAVASRIIPPGAQAPTGVVPNQAAAPPATTVAGAAATRPTMIPGAPPGSPGAAPIRAATPSPGSMPAAGAGQAPVSQAGGTMAPAPQASAAQAGGERGASYLLQAGAFRGPEDADAMKLRLALMGHEAQIVTADVAGTTLYRVRIGPYAGLDAMNRARARLAESGIEATVLRLR